MGSVLIDLLPLIVAAALLPAWMIITLFLLRGDGGVLRAAAFIVGAILVRLVVGVLFGFVFGSTGDPGESRAIASTLMLVVGVLLLVAAFKKWRKEDEPEEQPKWMDKISGVKAWQAFVAGALLMAIAVKQWVFSLSAIATIEAGGLDRGANILLFGAFTLLAQSLTILPVVYAAIAPSRSAKLLGAAEGWLARYNRPLAIGVSLVFGVWFVWQGVTGLMG
jgi:uncharacterized membrane protein YidH (DUF202 family)